MVKCLIAEECGAVNPGSKAPVHLKKHKIPADAWFEFKHQGDDQHAAPGATYHCKLALLLI